MKKIIILVLFTAIQLVGSQGPDEQVFTVSGVGNAKIQLSRAVVNSISVFERQLKDCSTKKLEWPADQESLNFLEKYATRRFVLKKSGDKVSGQVETALEDLITSQPLTKLACTTVMISDMYHEILPQGFDKAWMHQLNEEKIGKGQVESLITNQETVNFIFALQDQSRFLDRSLQDFFGLGDQSSASQEELSGKSTNDLEPVYLTLEQLSQQSWLNTARTDKNSGRIELDTDNDEDSEDKKPSLSRFASIKSAIFKRWSHMGRAQKLAMSGGGISIIAFVCLYIHYKNN